MSDQEITVVYRWTANPGKLDELKAIYEQVHAEMESTEPGTLRMETYFADDANEIIVHDVFKDGAALGMHLGGTAARHFPKLAETQILSYPLWDEMKGKPDTDVRREYDRKVAELRELIAGPFHELYDLNTDPDERTDLSASRPEKKARFCCVRRT